MNGKMLDVISFELPTFSYFVRYVVGNSKDIFLLRGSIVGDRALSTVFLYLYHLSSFKKCPILDLLIWFRTLCHFPLGFVAICPIGKRRRLALFFLYWRCALLGRGEGMFTVGVRILVKGFSCKSFFRLLLYRSPIGESVFDVIWRFNILNKIRFSIWPLLGCVNTLDRLVRRRTLHVRPFFCILSRKGEENLNHLFWGC